MFLETPSSLEVQALLWSEYKHHCTFNFLVAKTPNGAVSWVSPCYGERTTDIYIVQDLGFLDILEPMIQLWQIVGSRSSQILHSVDVF